MQKSEIRILVGGEADSKSEVLDHPQLSGIKVLENPDTPIEPTFYTAINEANEIVRAMMIHPEDRVTTGVAIGNWAAGGYRVERMSYKNFVRHMRVQTAPKEQPKPVATVEIIGNASGDAAPASAESTAAAPAPAPATEAERKPVEATPDSVKDQFAF